MKLKFRSKFNHGFTNHGYLHSDVWKALYNFKIKTAQTAKNNQFLFQNYQNNEIFEIFKMFKNNCWTTFTTQKAKAWSPWTACSVFDWKYHFLVNLIKTVREKCQFKLKFSSLTNLNMQNSMLMFTFSVFVKKYLFRAN